MKPLKKHLTEGIGDPHTGNLVLRSMRVGRIEVDEDEELCTLRTETGYATIGNIYDEDGSPSETSVAIHAEDFSSQGYTSIKVSDLKKLINAYNESGFNSVRI